MVCQSRDTAAPLVARAITPGKLFEQIGVRYIPLAPLIKLELPKELYQLRVGLRPYPLRERPFRDKLLIQQSRDDAGPAIRVKRWNGKR
jgi:hypothetical protein